jgi:hypothetical protein
LTWNKQGVEIVEQLFGPFFREMGRRPVPDPAPEKRKSPGLGGIAYVYAMRSDGRLVKIGRTGSMETRLRDISASNPYQLVVEDCIAAEFGETYAIEKRIHRELTDAGLHIRGEWFDAPPECVRRLFAKQGWRIEEKYIGITAADLTRGSRRGVRGRK